MHECYHDSSSFLRKFPVRAPTDPTCGQCCTRATLNGNNLKVLKGYYLERLFGWWKPQGLQGHQFEGWGLLLLNLALWGWSVLFVVGFMQCNHWNHKLPNIPEICGSACVDSVFAGEVKRGCKCPYRYGGAFVARFGPCWMGEHTHNIYMYIYTSYALTCVWTPDCWLPERSPPSP